jgi:hypothetical protein
MSSKLTSKVCLECGAAQVSDEQCGDRFNACMAKEFEDPTGYGVVHHLTVTTYMLQHPSRYSRQGWLEARTLLSDFLLKGKSPVEVRTQNRQRYDSGSRSWRVTKGERVTELAGVTWSRTIADVRLDNSAVYCADVKLWAQAVLSDTVRCL